MATRSPRTEAYRQFTAPGVEITVLAGEDDTDGAWSLFEYAAEAGFRGPPPHWHEELVEGFYMLEGTATFVIDGEDRRASPGEFLLVPARTVHSFELTDDGPGRFLLGVSPGGFEEYFEALGRLMADEAEWPPADMAPVVELMSRYDTHARPVN